MGDEEKTVLGRKKNEVGVSLLFYCATLLITESKGRRGFMGGFLHGFPTTNAKRLFAYLMK